MKESTLRECPFCHQFSVADDGKLPQEVCGGEGAVNWRGCRDRQIRLDEAVLEQFGSECEELNPAWRPLAQEHIDALRVMTEWVAFNSFAKISVLCADGSTCVITPKQVMRPMKISEKAEI